MSRLASVLDWSGSADGSGSGVGVRVLQSEICPRAPATAQLEQAEEDDAPTLVSSLAHEASLDRVAARTLVRLTALAEWMAKAEPESEVTRLLRGLLRDLRHVGECASAIVAAAAGTSAGPTASIVAQAVALWRAQVTEYADALAAAEDESLDGWSSLPEYAAMGALANVRPVLDGLAIEAERDDALAAKVRDLNEALARLDDTLRLAVRRARPTVSSTVAPTVAW